jgi:hypothetical protein
MGGHHLAADNFLPTTARAAPPFMDGNGRRFRAATFAPTTPKSAAVDAVAMNAEQSVKRV